jgi:hypothetical protein
MEETIDIGGLVFHAELALEKLRHPLDCPCVRIKSLAECALLEQPEHARVFPRLKPEWTTRRESDLQSIIPILVAGFAPSHDRARSNAQEATDLIHGEAGIEESETTTSPFLEVFCWTRRPRHGGVYSERTIA